MSTEASFQLSTAENHDRQLLNSGEYPPRKSAYYNPLVAEVVQLCQSASWGFFHQAKWNSPLRSQGYSRTVGAFLGADKQRALRSGWIRVTDIVPDCKICDRQPAAISSLRCSYPIDFCLSRAET